MNLTNGLCSYLFYHHKTQLSIPFLQSFNNTYCCSECISTFLKRSSNHLDEKYLLLESLKILVITSEQQ